MAKTNPETIPEIREHYGSEVAKLMTSLFDLAASVPAFEDAVSPSARERMPENEYNAIRASEQAKWAEEERERIKARVVELELEMIAAVEVRGEDVEELLTPNNVTADEIFRASSMTEQELLDALDIALDLGEEGEDAALLCFRVGRQKDLEMVVARAIDRREDWEELYGELQEAANQPEIEPATRFDMVAPEAPSKHDLINQLASAREQLY